MERDDKSIAQPDTPSSDPELPPEPYEPPKLLKFDRLEKLIVSGE